MNRYRNKIVNKIRKVKKYLNNFQIFIIEINQINKIINKNREVWDWLKDEEKAFIIEVNFIMGACLKKR